MRLDFERLLRDLQDLLNEDPRSGHSTVLTYKLRSVHIDFNLMHSRTPSLLCHD